MARQKSIKFSILDGSLFQVMCASARRCWHTLYKLPRKLQCESLKRSLFKIKFSLSEVQTSNVQNEVNLLHKRF